MTSIERGFMQTKIQRTANARARIIQAIDLYGADTVAQQFLHLFPNEDLSAVLPMLLELDRENWIRSLPHGPGSKQENTHLMGYWPDPVTDIVIERFKMGPGGTPVSRGLDTQKAKNDEIIKKMRESWKIKPTVKVEEEGLVPKLVRRLRNMFRKSTCSV